MGNCKNPPARPAGRWTVKYERGSADAAALRLPHAGNLAFPVGGTAPRNRRILGRLIGAAGENEAEKTKKQNEDESAEGVHRVN